MVDNEKPRRQMPRPAIKAIAYSGYLCGASTGFLAYYAWRWNYHPGFFWMNAIATVFLIFGSWWMLQQLKKA